MRSQEWLSLRLMMAPFVTKTIQQIRGLIILGGFVLLVIPFALILSGTAFIVILLSIGLFVAAITWKKILWIKLKLSNL